MKNIDIDFEKMYKELFEIFNFDPEGTAMGEISLMIAIGVIKKYHKEIMEQLKSN